MENNTCCPVCYEGHPCKCEEPDKSIEFIKMSLLWPKFPLLPVKNLANGRLAVIHCKDLTTVRFDNVFLAPCEYGEFKKLEGVTYESVEELVDDGWMVD